MWTSKSDCKKKQFYTKKKLLISKMQAYNLACYSSTTSNDQFLFNELFNAFSGSYGKLLLSAMLLTTWHQEMKAHLRSQSDKKEINTICGDFWSLHICHIEFVLWNSDCRRCLLICPFSCWIEILLMSDMQYETFKVKLQYDTFLK